MKVEILIRILVNNEQGFLRPTVISTTFLMFYASKARYFYANSSNSLDKDKSGMQKNGKRDDFN